MIQGSWGWPYLSWNFWGSDWSDWPQHCHRTPHKKRDKSVLTLSVVTMWTMRTDMTRPMQSFATHHSQDFPRLGRRESAPCSANNLKNSSHITFKVCCFRSSLASNMLTANSSRLSSFNFHSLTKLSSMMRNTTCEECSPWTPSSAQGCPWPSSEPIHNPLGEYEYCLKDLDNHHRHDNSWWV